MFCKISMLIDFERVQAEWAAWAEAHAEGAPAEEAQGVETLAEE